MTALSHAESARTLVTHHTQGVLSTLDRRSGAPYGSVSEYAPLENGDALLFVSDLADHTKNIDEDPRASLLVADGLGDDQALADERVTLVGAVEPIADDATEAMRERYLEAHPHAETYIDFDDFAFYRLVPERLRYIGGFGRMSWVELGAYRDAEPDPTRPAAPGIIEHMNDDHPDSLVDMARGLADFDWAENAVMTEVDRYGFEMIVEGEVDGGPHEESTRIAFEEVLDEASEAREAMIVLVEEARNALEERNLEA